MLDNVDNATKYKKELLASAGIPPLVLSHLDTAFPELSGRQSDSFDSADLQGLVMRARQIYLAILSTTKSNDSSQCKFEGAQALRHLTRFLAIHLNDLDSYFSWFSEDELRAIARNEVSIHARDDYANNLDYAVLTAILGVHLKIFDSNNSLKISFDKGHCKAIEAVNNYYNRLKPVQSLLDITLQDATEPSIFQGNQISVIHNVNHYTARLNTDGAEIPAAADGNCFYHAMAGSYHLHNSSISKVDQIKHDTVILAKTLVGLTSEKSTDQALEEKNVPVLPSPKAVCPQSTKSECDLINAKIKENFKQADEHSIINADDTQAVDAQSDDRTDESDLCAIAEIIKMEFKLDQNSTINSAQVTKFFKLQAEALEQYKQERTHLIA